MRREGVLAAPAFRAMVVLFALMGGAFTGGGCRSPGAGTDRPVLLGQNGEGSSPQVMTTARFSDEFAAIRRLMVAGRYQEAMLRIDALGRHDLPSTLARALGQLRTSCLREGFLARHPLTAELHGPPARGSCVESLNLEFVVHNGGADAVSIEAEDGSLWSWLGLADAPRSLLRLTVEERTSDGLGAEQKSRENVDVWLEQDLLLEAGGGATIAHRIKLSEAPRAVWREVRITAVLLPLGIVTAEGDSIYLPIEFPAQDYEMFIDDEVDVLEAPLGALRQALANGDARRLFCAVMALRGVDFVAGVDLLLGELGRVPPALRRAGLGALRLRIPRRYGADLESWRGWWLSEGRAEWQVTPKLGSRGESRANEPIW